MASDQSQTTKIEVIQGPEGPCLSINNYRICGPKPWGGGTVIASWTVRMSVPDLLKEIPAATPYRACETPGTIKVEPSKLLTERTERI